MPHPVVLAPAYVHRVQRTRSPMRCQTQALPALAAQTETIPGVGSQPNSASSAERKDEPSGGIIGASMLLLHLRIRHLLCQQCITSMLYVAAGVEKLRSRSARAV